jgi:3-phenylpropionate/trans-cinnamate dioxygenase ferredoxin subunit
MIEVASLSDLPKGSTLRVDLEGYRLCLINIDDTIYVLDDRCSHADFSLSEGMLDEEECEIECPKHGAIFDVKTGKPKSLPATRPVTTYTAVTRDGKIFLEEEEDNAGN